MYMYLSTNESLELKVLLSPHKPCLSHTPKLFLFQYSASGWMYITTIAAGG